MRRIRGLMHAPISVHGEDAQTGVKIYEYCCIYDGK